jgi:hypothetical protein
MLGEALALQPEKGRIDGTVDCLDELAALALDQGDATGAARLAGAADAILERAGFRRVPVRAEASRATTAAVEERLDAEQLAAARAAGAAPSPAQLAWATWNRAATPDAEPGGALPAPAPDSTTPVPSESPQLVE